MSGSRIKKLKKEAYRVYMATLTNATIRDRKKMLPFKNIFNQIKRLYKTGLPIYKQTQAGVGWPTKK